MRSSNMPRQQHVAQAELQVRRREMRIPRPDGAMIVAEHAHHLVREGFGLRQRRGRVGPRHRAGRRELHVAEVRLLARAGGRSRNVQSGSDRTHRYYLRLCDQPLRHLVGDVAGRAVLRARAREDLRQALGNLADLGFDGGSARAAQVFAPDADDTSGVDHIVRCIQARRPHAGAPRPRPSPAGCWRRPQ